MPELPLADPPVIVVTASRAEESADRTNAAVAIVDATRIQRLGSPMVVDYLRLVPSAAVSISGPAGSQAQVRIRGAEANHTLLFVDGIRANDPAAGNEPRFELLNADLASQIEVVRGPQSALWGSEAIGGVVAVHGRSSSLAATQLSTEFGSHESWRAAGSTSLGSIDRGIALGAAGQGSDGMDAFSGDGERDGYRNFAARVAGRYRPTPSLLIGGSSFAFHGKSQFDGYDPTTFQRADTRDESSNRLAAGRIFAQLGQLDHSYVTASMALLGSSNRNLLDGDALNRTWASRRTVSLETGHQLGRHQFIAALESEREAFHSRDMAGTGLSDQDRTRRHDSITAEWRAEPIQRLTTDIAVRHDIFSRFEDATSFRASIRAEVSPGVSVIATYGEGIAQPTFFDLYGFYPGFFVGNASLKPERSRGWEVSARLKRSRMGGSITYFRQRLTDEIIDSPDFTTTLNADGTSWRQGFEVEGYFVASALLRIAANYAYLDATEQKVAGVQRQVEQRRPKHSAAISFDGQAGPWTYAASIAYVGRHRDRRDSLPYELVDLDPYWMTSARLARKLNERLEASLRVANLLGNQTSDLVGYRTEGRTIHAGLRFALGS